MSKPPTHNNSNSSDGFSSDGSSWNPDLYNDKHSFVFKYGEDLAALLKPHPGERILDLGCGTGYLTSVIANSGAQVTGIDNSIEMIAKAKTEYPHLDFRVQSASDFYFEDRFDAIFSNAVLHWVQEKEASIDCMYKSLKKPGRIVLEMGGKDNIEKIIKALQRNLIKHGFDDNASLQLWYFPSLSEYTTLLEKRGFRVTFAVHYDRETKLNDDENGIKEWIRMFASPFFKGLDDPSIELVLEEVQDSLKPVLFKNDHWYADYKRLRIIAVK
jgi:trans-aconitate methyltransferase